jgi:hypothetical protein
VRGEVRLETQGDPLALRHHCSTDHLLCIPSMVAWLSNSKCQEEARQSTKIGILRDNGSDSYDSYWCYGGTRWPPSIGSSDTGRGKISSTAPLKLGVLVLPSLQSRKYTVRSKGSQTEFFTAFLTMPSTRP